MSQHDQPLLSQPRPLDFVSRTYAYHAVALMIPVSITIFIVVWSVENLTPIDQAREQSPAFVVANEPRGSAPAAQKAGAASLNVLVLLGIIVVVTVLMLVLYKLRLIKVILAWFGFSAALIFIFFVWMWVDLFCTRYQIPYDMPGMAFFIWNVAIVGLVSLFWHAPPKLSQAYNVILAVVIAWIFIRLPEWSSWAILVAVAIYDIVAVLWTSGPLHMLVKEAQKQNEPIPGFVYDANNETQELAREPPPPAPAAPAAVTAPADTGENATHGDTAARPPAAAAARAKEEESEEEEEEDPFESADGCRHFKLGLGDFIFYSLLVGRASQYTYVSWTLSYVAVINGLLGTLTSLLFFRGKVPALPALPFSIFFGVAIFFLSRFVTVPFCYYTSVASIVI